MAVNVRQKLSARFSLWRGDCSPTCPTTIRTLFVKNARALALTKRIQTRRRAARIVIFNVNIISSSVRARECKKGETCTVSWVVLPFWKKFYELVDHHCPDKCQLFSASQFFTAIDFNEKLLRFLSIVTTSLEKITPSIYLYSQSRNLKSFQSFCFPRVSFFKGILTPRGKWENVVKKKKKKKNCKNSHVRENSEKFYLWLNPIRGFEDWSFTSTSAH